MSNAKVTSLKCLSMGISYLILSQDASRVLNETYVQAAPDLYDHHTHIPAISGPVKDKKAPSKSKPKGISKVKKRSAVDMDEHQEKENKKTKRVTRTRSITTPSRYK